MTGSATGNEKERNGRPGYVHAPYPRHTSRLSETIQPFFCVTTTATTPFPAATFQVITGYITPEVRMVRFPSHANGRVRWLGLLPSLRVMLSLSPPRKQQFHALQRNADMRFAALRAASRGEITNPALGHVVRSTSYGVSVAKRKERV